MDERIYDGGGGENVLGRGGWDVGVLYYRDCELIEIERYWGVKIRGLREIT